MEPYSLPAATHVLAAALQVSGLERALAFYHDLVGLRPIRREDGQAWLAADAGGPALLRLVERPGARPKPPRTTGLYHVAVRLPDERALGRLLQRLIDQGWPLQGASDHLVSAAVYTADPDGNGLEFYADRPREAWPRLNGVIQMATEPLAAQGALLEGMQDASPWEGIAAGTDVGHVHLHVADLARARRFYHDWLGLDVTQESYPGALFLAAGGYHHHLGLNVWAGVGAPPPPEDAAGLLAFTLAIPGAAALDEVVARLRANGAAPEATPDGWQVRDADGIRLELALVPEPAAEA